MKHTRREFLATAGAAGAACMSPAVSQADEKPSVTKNHIVTLSFDDGFRKSSVKTAEIYEKYKLSACINVVASASMKDFRAPDWGPIRASYLERLLERLRTIETVEVLPVGKALARVVGHA